MSIRNKRISEMNARIQQAHAAARDSRGFVRFWHNLRKWCWMLMHEWLRDDVLIRAPSMRISNGENPHSIGNNWEISPALGRKVCGGC